MTPELSDVPEHIGAITPDWLSRALDLPIRSVRSEMLGEGQGFLGDIVRLHLETDAEDAPRSVVAKLPKLANRSVGEMMGVYEREHLFFRDLAQRVPVRVPRIHFSHYDPDRGAEKQKQILRFCDRMPRFMTTALAALGKAAAGAKQRRYLLIMEDLRELTPGDQLAGGSIEQCASVLEQFAATHRAFWGAADLDDKFWLLPFDIDARMREGMFRKSAPALHAVAPDGMRPYIEKLSRFGADLSKRLTAEAPTTLAHCDLRLDNMCFDGDACTFLDWQLVRSGPAAYDVAYFLGGALSPETTAAEEQHILRRYHDALGVADYPFEQLHRDYQRGLLVSLAALAPSADFAIDEGRGESMMQRWRERLLARLAHVDLERIL